MTTQLLTQNLWQNDDELARSLQNDAREMENQHLSFSAPLDIYARGDRTWKIGKRENRK